jgi:hypothetical protein
MVVPTALLLLPAAAPLTWENSEPRPNAVRRIERRLPRGSTLVDCGPPHGGLRRTGNRFIFAVARPLAAPWRIHSRSCGKTSARSSACGRRPTTSTPN